MNRRTCLILLSGAGLAGCAVEEPIQFDNPKQLRVTRVVVGIENPEAIDKRLANWDIGVDRERFISDVRSALTRELEASTRSGTRPVTAQVSLTGITLDSAIPGMLQPIFVGPFSQISGRLILSDARSGEVLLRRNVLGDDNPGDITFGAVFRSGFSGGKSLEKAYRDVVNGFAEDVARQIFEVENAGQS